MALSDEDFVIEDEDGYTTESEVNDKGNDDESEESAQSTAESDGETTQSESQSESESESNSNSDGNEEYQMNEEELQKQMKQKQMVCYSLYFDACSCYINTGKSRKRFTKYPQKITRNN